MKSGQNQEEDEEVAKGVRLLISVLGLCLWTWIFQGFCCG